VYSPDGLLLPFAHSLLEPKVVRPMNLNSPVARRVRNALFIGIFLYLTCHPHGGLFVLGLLPFFACFWLYDLIFLVRRPEGRIRRTERLVTWMLAFGVAGAVNLYWSWDARAYANKVVGAVVNYRARSGTWPTDLENVGISQATAVRKWMLVYAVDERGRPGLIYPSPWDGFDTYSYDFDTGHWNFWAD
jgi:hypothetical protein